MSLRELLGLRASKPAAGARIIVVSNRLPLTLKRTGQGWDTTRSSGGLASAMNPLLGKAGGEWIGWAGDSGGEDSQKTLGPVTMSGNQHRRSVGSNLVR